MILLTRSYVITEDGLEWITPEQYESLKDQIDQEDN